MKKSIMIVLGMLVLTFTYAQEKMKVILTDGTTVEYEVKKIKQVSFEGSDIVLTTGAASSITSNSVVLSYGIEGAEGSIAAGVILSTNKDFDNGNDRNIVMQASFNGQNSIDVEGLTASTTYYYRAVALLNNQYCYGESRSFTTAADMIYHEPFTSWGASKWQTKNYMTGYKIYDEKDNSLTYYGKDLEALIGYSFQNSLLVTATVVVPASQTTIKAIGQQLKKNNYKVLDDSGDMPIYISADAKTTVAVLKDEESDAFYIRYMDTNSIIGEVLFEEPFITWNTSRSKVKETIRNRGYEMVDESNNASDYYYVAYFGKEKEKYSFYFFNSNLQLEEVRITLDGSKFSVEEVRKYLANQLSYNYVGTSSDKTQYYYLTKDSKTLVIVKKMDSNYISVGYSPYTTNGARKMNTGFTDGDKYDIEINRIKTEVNSHGISRTLQKKIIQAVNENRSMWPIHSIK